MATLMGLIVAAPAIAQRSTSDRDLLNRPHSGGLSSEDRKRLDELKQGEQEEQQMTAARARAARALRKTPPVPAERNGLLGSWRLSDGQRPNSDAVDALTRRSGLGETLGALKSLDNFGCGLDWGGGITFTPSTFSWGAIPPFVQARGGPIAYRSGRRGDKQVIVAITDYDSALAFEIASPNSIVDDKGCVLVRVGAPGASATASATGAPGNARAGASGASAPPAAGARPQVADVAPAPPRSTLARPSPEVCRNRLLDKLGVVGVNQVRAMSDARFRETTIEGKVPNTNNLRLDLRGSACDDPRIKATLYDFDANGMLESITYVWDRPAGPAPAPIFSERVTHLTRVLSLPPPQTSGRLQADTSVGRLILQDMPERNLLLEAYRK
jgi:hypothetical protein